LPHDKPLWIQLPESLNEATQRVLEGLPTQAIAVCTDAKSKSRRALYNSMDKVLARLTSDPYTDIEYHDDPDWTLFPELMVALRKHGDPEGTFVHVATHRSVGVWGVGVSSRWKGRCLGAKLAIAAMLALQAPGEIPFAAGLEDFAKFAMDVQRMTWG